MARAKILQKPWSYTLYADDVSGEYFLSVVCGSVGIYEVDALLSEDEVKKVLVDNDYLELLALKMRQQSRS